MKKNVLLAVAVVFILAACSPSGDQRSLSGAKQVENMFEVPLNSSGLTVEQQNIVDRLRVTTDPTKVMWIHLISLDGKILKRMPVKNKVTSSGKRLEPLHATGTQASWYPNFGQYETDELITGRWDIRQF